MRSDMALIYRRQHRTARRVKPVQALHFCGFARWARLDISPFQIKFRLSASWVRGSSLGLSVGVTVKNCNPFLWAHVTCVTQSMTNRRQDAYTSWACRGSHTLLVAANVGKNGTGDCARDTHWKRRKGKNGEERGIYDAAVLRKKRKPGTRPLTTPATQFD